MSDWATAFGGGAASNHDEDSPKSNMNNAGFGFKATWGEDQPAQDDGFDDFEEAKDAEVPAWAANAWGITN